MTNNQTDKKASPTDKRALRTKKFVVSVDKTDNVNLDMISSKLLDANKDHIGDEITFSDLALFAINKLNEKDMTQLKAISITESKLSDLAVDQYNRSNNTRLSKDQILLNLLKVNKSKLISENVTPVN